MFSTFPLWEKDAGSAREDDRDCHNLHRLQGKPVTKHSGRTEFCSVIRENPVSRKRCYRCDALAGLEAVRLERPYIYLCHCGIVDVAVPVMVGDKYLGAVMFGQVRLVNKDRGEGRQARERNKLVQAEEDAARKDLLEKYESCRRWSTERIVEIADLIDSIVKYTVNRAVKARNRDETYKWLMSTNSRAVGRRGGDTGAFVADERT